MSDDKHNHGDVHVSWAWNGVGERVHYRLGGETRYYTETKEIGGKTIQLRRAKFGPTREITTKQAESYMLVPDKDYAPKDGILDMAKWVAYKGRLCDSISRLEEDKPGTIVRRPENP